MRILTDFISGWVRARSLHTGDGLMHGKQKMIDNFFAPALFLGQKIRCF